MSKEFHPVFLIIFLTLLISSTFFDVLAAAANDAFRPVNPNDREVVAIGKFAVEENNKQKKQNIQFQNVSKAAWLRVGDKTAWYALLIKADEDGISSIYVAEVVDNKNSGKELIGFKRQNVASLEDMIDNFKNNVEQLY